MGDALVDEATCWGETSLTRHQYHGFVPEPLFLAAAQSRTCKYITANVPVPKELAVCRVVGSEL